MRLFVFILLRGVFSNMRDIYNKKQETPKHNITTLKKDEQNDRKPSFLLKGLGIKTKT